MLKVKLLTSLLAPCLLSADSASDESELNKAIGVDGPQHGRLGAVAALSCMQPQCGYLVELLS